MKRREPSEKGSWEDLENRVGMKRNAGRESKKAVGKVPNDILLQRMSSTASGRLKKYEPLDTRDFASFENYDELSVEKIKEACEKFYNAPPGLAISLSQIEALRARNSSRLKVAKCTSFDFFHQMRMPNASFVRKKLKDLSSLQTAQDQPQPPPRYLQARRTF